jgi:glutamyl/glutaminyl-tRNA synthetase
VGSTTRFAPAPTGRLHLGHLVNALFVWGMARGRDGRVLLRLEDHDRQRCRPEFERHLLDDLDRLGLRPDEPATDGFRAGATTFRQSDAGAVYAAALERLRAAAAVYACDCSRATFAAWAEAHGRPWSGPGCPGGCAGRGLPEGHGVALRVALGSGTERWRDELLGWREGEVAAAGDPPVRDRRGNWTYGFCVVVDDARQGVDLVVRGEDLLDATATQIGLARALGRATPPRFAHHPLILRPDGSKLSKADGATSVGSRLDAGDPPEALFGEAAAAVGLAATPRPLALEAALTLVVARDRAAQPMRHRGG